MTTIETLAPPPRAAKPSGLRHAQSSARHTGQFWAIKTGVEKPSRVLDALFAIALASAFTGISYAKLHLTLFTLPALICVFWSAGGILHVSRSLRVVNWALVAFLIVHVASAFTLSRSNGLVFLLPAIVDFAFVWSMVNRYSQISMAYFIRACGVCFFLLLIAVVAFNVRHGHLTSMKQLTNGKAVFDILPLMLLVLKTSRTRSSKRTLLWTLPLFGFLILISGERKAYILMALFLPFIVNWRSPWTYIAPFAMLGTLPIALSFDKSGYVLRQVTTLFHLGSGQVDTTWSNIGRLEAFHFALSTFYHNPLVGVGTNVTYLLNLIRGGHNVGTHNEWLRVASDNGLLGLTPFLLAVVLGGVGLFRRRLWGRYRGWRERRISIALFVTCLMYVSFEAHDFRVLMAFIVGVMCQYMRLDPDGLSPEPARPRAPVSRTMRERRASPTPAVEPAKV